MNGGAAAEAMLNSPRCERSVGLAAEERGNIKVVVKIA